MYLLQQLSSVRKDIVVLVSHNDFLGLIGLAWAQGHHAVTILIVRFSVRRLLLVPSSRNVDVGVATEPEQLFQESHGDAARSLVSCAVCGG